MPLPARVQDEAVTPVGQVIYLHGFASSPASSKAAWFRRVLAERGVGYSCPDLNEPAFETLTVTRMVAQAKEAIAGAGADPVALVGSSLGAFVAVHAAATSHRVDRLILLAPALDFGGNRLRQFGPHGIEDWRRHGSIEVHHHGYGGLRRIGFDLYDDAARYDAFALPSRIPTLVFQGLRDASVDPGMVKRWADSRPNVTLRLLDDEHQLTASMAVIWQESEAFLGLER